MTACKDFDLFLPLHATGALDPAESALLETHLAACAACRAEAGRDAEALALAKLPPPSEAERRDLADAPRRALAALHRADARRARWKRSLAGIAVAAAALLAVLAPVLLGRPPPPPQQQQAQEVATAATWQEPDLDAIWDDTRVLELDATATADAGDAALAALDY